MTPEEIFKEALVSLSREGNEKAKFALEIASKHTDTAMEIRPALTLELKDAVAQLSIALKLAEDNDYRTNNAVDAALKNIVSAMEILARR